MPTQRTRHLIILAHLWALSPFLVASLLVSPGRAPLPADDGPNPAMLHFWLAAVAYLVVRTALAWRDPRWLRWEYVFPPLDAVIVGVALAIRGGNAGSSLFLLYLFPVAEAASTLDVRYAAGIGLFSAASAAAATFGRPDPHGAIVAVFRLVILILMASLLTWLARLAADLRAQLHVAADRNRIAMEMHDGVQAQLVAIAQQMELARHVAPRDGAKAGEIASEARDVARKAADDLRFLVYRLRAPRLSEGFVPALQQYAHNLSGRSGVPIEMRVDGQPWPLDPDAEHALFRIVQESLTNTLKHAGAAKVDISLQYEPSAVQCVVRDNGRGFAPDTIDGLEGHYGLQTMRERATQLGGEVTLETRPGEGTAVITLLPRLAGARALSREAP